MSNRKRHHPGLELAKEIKRRGMTPYECAVRLKLRPPRIYELCKGMTTLSPIMALRLARLLGGNPEDWLSMQAAYDLSVLERKYARELRDIDPWVSKNEG
ncbi:MAG: HigA family addiction module antidote protein [Nitrospira sp.]|nr:HigA family addiction module antidote protein [Nitrospira sp.]MBS0194353.1 HigA family addiction module antidote protein [Pseudomonadota bacterium]